VDLSTSYLGLRLPQPLMAGASPLADDLDSVRRLEDAGAAAIVLRSLFEEQLTGGEPAQLLGRERRRHPGDATAYALADPMGYAFGPDRYAVQVQRIKEAVAVPVIASLNGTTPGGWLAFARLLAEAGADALELNVYRLVTDAERRGEEVEAETVEMVREVKAAVAVPVAVKLSPFYTALVHFAHALVAAGADGLVLFNRFYQPDIDVEALAVTPALHLSDSGELLLRLRWLAILSGRTGASLAASGGVHTATDVVKALLAGADAVQVVSALLERGPEHLGRLRRGLEEWLESHGVDSLGAMRGRLDLERCADPGAYERANYLYILQQREAER
jgi:dihydroorotate dehydrogenase (fumarate)